MTPARNRKPAQPAPPSFDIDAAFRIDEAAANETGARIELAPGVAIWVARMNNPVYAEALLKFYRENRFALERQLLDQNVADEKLCKILADTIFLKWEGFVHQGEPLEDTPEKRCWGLVNYPALREKVVEESQNFANFRAAEVAAEGKGSAKGSGGNSPTEEGSASSES